MSGYTFNITEDDVAGIREDAAEFQKDYKEKEVRFEPRPALAYLQEGNHLIRIYPDEDSRGKKRFYRRIWSHRSFPVSLDKKKKAFIWRDDRVDSTLKELEDKGMKNLFGEDLWKFKSQEQGIICAHVYDSSDKQNHPPGSTMAMVLNPKQLFGFIEWMTTLHPKEVVTMFNPFEDAPGIRFGVSKGSKSNMSVGVDGTGTRKLSLPIPPQLWDSNWKKEIEAGKGFEELTMHEFTGLDDLGRKETDVLSDEEFEIFQELCMREFEAFKAKDNRSINDSSIGKGSRPGQNEEKKELKTSGANGSAKPGSSANSTGQRKSLALKKELPETGERNCPLADRISKKENLKEIYGDQVKFGNKPGQSNPQCMVCPNEKDCIKLTEQNLEASKAA